MDQIIKLLEFWKKYKEQGFSDDFARFGIWLNNEIPSEQDTSSTPQEVLEGDKNTKIGYYLGELIEFSDHWTKLAFRNLPITGWTDFGILKGVEYSDTPTKKELVQHAVAEQSTIFEAIKRLQKYGLLEEVIDKDDRRVRRVKMTKEGKKVIDAATHQAIQLSNLFVADLSEDEKKVLIDILLKLNNFHRDLYQEMPKEKVVETYGL